MCSVGGMQSVGLDGRAEQSELSVDLGRVKRSGARVGRPDGRTTGWSGWSDATATQAPTGIAEPGGPSSSCLPVGQGSPTTVQSLRAWRGRGRLTSPARRRAGCVATAAQTPLE